MDSDANEKHEYSNASARYQTCSSLQKDTKLYFGILVKPDTRNIFCKEETTVYTCTFVKKQSTHLAREHYMLLNYETHHFKNDIWRVGCDLLITQYANEVDLINDSTVNCWSYPLLVVLQTTRFCLYIQQTLDYVC